MTINSSHPSDDSALSAIRGEKRPLIIFGSATVGEALLHACRDSGLAVECFRDNNVGKTRGTVHGLAVLHAPKLKERYKDAAFLISAADIGDVVGQLQRLGYDRWHPASALLRDFDVRRHEFGAPPDFVEYAVATCISCQDSFLDPDKLFFRSVDIIITERCSLKCRDCSNLMQFYENPADHGPEEVIRSIDALCSVADDIHEFRVIGGEPFMNRSCPAILRRLLDEPKVKKVVVYTNGTIVPKEDVFECLNHKKILLLITDYGPLSRNLGALTGKLKANGISFYSHEAKGWTDCSKIERHLRSAEQQKGVFGFCCAKNTFTLTDGKLYRCPFSANACRLRAVPDFPGDYIDLFEGADKAETADRLKRTIKSFVFEKDVLEICDFCSGRPFDAGEISPAVQIREPLQYKKY